MNIVTIEFMNNALEPIHKAFIHVAEMFLSKLSTAEIDKIPTLKVTEEEKKVFDNNATVIDIPYSNDKGMISLYCIGSSFVKLIV